MIYAWNKLIFYTFRNKNGSRLPTNIMSQLNKQYSQLKKSVKKLESKESHNLTYSVLSKILTAAKESAAGTANVLTGSTASDLYQ